LHIPAFTTARVRPISGSKENPLNDGRGRLGGGIEISHRATNSGFDNGWTGGEADSGNISFISTLYRREFEPCPRGAAGTEGGAGMTRRIACADGQAQKARKEATQRPVYVPALQSRLPEALTDCLEGLASRVIVSKVFLCRADDG
jgi:hypothetical protein